MSDYSEHNEKYEDDFYKLLEETQYDIKFVVDPYYNEDIQNDIKKLLKMSYEQGVLSVHNQNGWEYKMEYPE